MITVTANELAKLVADDLGALRAMLTEIDAMFDRVVPGPERDAMIRHTAKVRLLTAELPMRIAERGPFKDRAHIERCAQGEVRRVLIALTEAEIFLKTVGSA